MLRMASLPRLLYVIILSCVSTFTLLVFVTQNKPALLDQADDLPGVGRALRKFVVPLSPEMGFLLNTEHCKIPDIDPFDQTVMRKLRHRGKIICKYESSITYVEGSVLKLNRTAIEVKFGGDFKYCQYQPIRRGAKNNDFSFEYGDLSKKFDHDILIPPEDEFMRVYCYSQSEGKIFTNFHAAVTPKENVERRCDYNFKQHVQKNAPKETYNVHMIGVDSVSRLNFIRQFRQTRQFLEEELGAFEMSGYNKVADNTFVNIVPMMVGKYVQEIGWNETMRKHPFDEYRFLWKNFSKAGYRTMYAEDAPKVAIFVYAKEGFHEPPADYYNRPLSLAIEKQKNVWNSGHHCVAERLETTMLLDYVTDFSRVLKTKPHFSFTFITRLTHDNIELAGSADFAYVKFLRRFKEEGHLNNTIIIFYSDHGYRFGEMRASYIGKVEERLPFMYLIFPPSFHEKYPQLVKNLRTNSKRLTTPFDIHETLIDILYFDGANRKADLKSRGISLLSEIPVERTCDHAQILPHWCLCLEQKNLNITSKLSGSIGKAVVRHINDQLRPVSHLCSVLKLDNVSEVVQMESNEKVLRFTDSFHDVINRTVVYGNRTAAPVVYQVTLTTLPGKAQFEATLIYEPSKELYRLGGDISRVNTYNNQSVCVDNSKLKKFCFCLEQATR